MKKDTYCHVCAVCPLMIGASKTKHFLRCFSASVVRPQTKGNNELLFLPGGTWESGGGGPGGGGTSVAKARGDLEPGFGPVGDWHPGPGSCGPRRLNMKMSFIHLLAKTVIFHDSLPCSAFASHRVG